MSSLGARLSVILPALHHIPIFRAPLTGENTLLLPHLACFSLT